MTIYDLYTNKFDWIVWLELYELFGHKNTVLHLASVHKNPF